MAPPPLTIWCNAKLPEDALHRLKDGLGTHRLIQPASLEASNLVAGGQDPAMADADVAFGQPDPGQCLRLQRLRWVHLTSAGYTRYDRADLRDALGARGAILTNSSSVYDDPCAQHVLAMMLALARRLPQAMADQQHRRWNYLPLRSDAHLLTGQTALLVGFGTIARRLVELLRPFNMTLIGIRRSVRGDEPIEVRPRADLDALLPAADHVINLLPAAADSDGTFDAPCFARMKAGAVFYNVGRGSTVDQAALRDALSSGHLSAAFLDVTTPEPLPPDDPLWSTPNCFITPHTAGGHTDEFDRLVAHFLENLTRFEQGRPLRDRVM